MVSISKGYKGYRSGLTNLLHKLRLNGKIEYEKDYLWGLEPKDVFIMENIVDNYVIYSQENDADVKIGINKKPKHFYQTGSYLNTNILFSLDGVKEFKTIIGTTIQILIIKEVKR